MLKILSLSLIMFITYNGLNINVLSIIQNKHPEGKWAIENRLKIPAEIYFVYNGYERGAGKQIPGQNRFKKVANSRAIFDLGNIDVKDTSIVRVEFKISDILKEKDTPELPKFFDDYSTDGLKPLETRESFEFRDNELIYRIDLVFFRSKEALIDEEILPGHIHGHLCHPTNGCPDL